MLEQECAVAGVEVQEHGDDDADGQHRRQRLLHLSFPEKTAALRRAVAARGASVGWTDSARGGRARYGVRTTPNNVEAVAQSEVVVNDENLRRVRHQLPAEAAVLQRGFARLAKRN